MRLSEYCDQHGIILYALPPNATHMIQPADVSVFRPLKAEWKNTVHEWAMQPENANTVLTKSTFCPLLKKVLEKENLPITITNGFRICGLYPCDPNALDYSKCVQNNLNKYQNSATSHGDSPCIKISKKHLNIARKVISQLGNDLAKAGVDAKLIVSVLESAKDTKGTDSLNSTDTSTTAASVADNTSLASNADRNQSLVADPESMQNPDECTLQPNIANTDAKKVHTANLQIEKKESSKIKPIICSNVIIKSTNPSPILKKHSVLPDVSKSTSKQKSINRIGAISSEEWRQFEKQKQEVKEQKKNNILLKKMKRLEVKQKKEEEMRKRKEGLKRRRTAKKES
nr:unnamed protein product [Callosobruchus analis]